MKEAGMPTKLVNAISELKEKEALAMVTEMAEKGNEPMVILDQVREAMEIVGKRYEDGIYFLPELIMAGEIMNQIKKTIQTKKAGTHSPAYRGRIIMGTVQGDIHNIGKDIVTFMLDSNGYEVLDLGVDVPAQKFIDAIRNFKPQVVGLSAFLTLAYDVMKQTIAEFEKQGLRQQVKVMIGGGSIDERVRVYTGADGYGKNAMTAVKMANEWIGG